MTDHIHVHLHGRHEPRHAAADDDCEPRSDTDFFRNETLEQFIHRFNALESAVTAFIDAQPAIDAVVAELTTARGEVAAKDAEIASLKAEAANRTVNLQPLQDVAAGIAADLAPDAPAPTAPVATLYEHTTDSDIDPAYVLATATLPDGTALYTYAGDADGSATGVSADFSVYSGPTVNAG